MRPFDLFYLNSLISELKKTALTTNRSTNRPMDGQTLLWKCEDASENSKWCVCEYVTPPFQELYRSLRRDFKNIYKRLENKTEWSTMRPSATFIFIVVLKQLFHCYSPRTAFLLVAPPSSSLFLPRSALSKSLRICKSQFFIDFDESITNQPTDQPTNQPTDGQGLL